MIVGKITSELTDVKIPLVQCCFMLPAQEKECPHKRVPKILPEVIWPKFSKERYTLLIFPVRNPHMICDLLKNGRRKNDSASYFTKARQEFPRSLVVRFALAKSCQYDVCIEH